jgi:hypothetical protein
LLREILGPITAMPTEAEGERFLTAHLPGMSGLLKADESHEKAQRQGGRAEDDFKQRIRQPGCHP